MPRLLITIMNKPWFANGWRLVHVAHFTISVCSLHLYLLLTFKWFLVVKEYACIPEMCKAEPGESEFQAHPKLHKKIKSWSGQSEIISQRNSRKSFLSNTQKNWFLHDIFKHLGHCSYSSFISYVFYCSPSYY